MQPLHAPFGIYHDFDHPEQRGVVYACAAVVTVILMATDLYNSVPPVLGWLTNNSAGHYKQATAVALQLAIANYYGSVTVFVYPKDQGPQYHRGHTIILGLLVGGWFL